jgi:ATP-binding cassette, subfamily G (WHITE), member 2, SNQ2
MAGQAILCTIHQPNDALFEQFDRLLLLEHGGRTIYFGEIGEDACALRDYFKRNGAECPPQQNPAEFMLEVIGAGSRPRVGPRDWADIWAESPEFEEVKKQIARIKDERRAVQLDRDIEKGEYATPLFHQVKIVLRRMNLTFWRSPSYGTFTLDFTHPRVYEVVCPCRDCTIHWRHILATWEHVCRFTKQNLCNLSGYRSACYNHATS